MPSRVNARTFAKLYPADLRQSKLVWKANAGEVSNPMREYAPTKRAVQTKICRNNDLFIKIIMVVKVEINEVVNHSMLWKVRDWEIGLLPSYRDIEDKRVYRDCLSGLL